MFTVTVSLLLVRWNLGQLVLLYHYGLWVLSFAWFSLPHRAYVIESSQIYSPITHNCLSGSVIGTSGKCLDFRLLCFEIRDRQMWLESKIEEKYRIFDHPPPPVNLVEDGRNVWTKFTRETNIWVILLTVRRLDVWEIRVWVSKSTAAFHKPFDIRRQTSRLMIKWLK